MSTPTHLDLMLDAVPRMLGMDFGSAEKCIRAILRPWPVRRKLIGGEVIRFRHFGHDPRNHHGYFMHDHIVDYRCVGHHFEYIVIDDLVPSYDPRNHTGSNL